MAVALQSAEMVGAVDPMFSLTLEYASDRLAFGRPLNSYQALKHRFADMKLWLEGCHGTATGRPGRGERRGQRRRADQRREGLRRRPIDGLLQDCVQLHGGIGVTWEHDLHLYLRRAAAGPGPAMETPAEHRERIAGALAL